MTRVQPPPLPLHKLKQHPPGNAENLQAGRHFPRSDGPLVEGGLDTRPSTSGYVSSRPSTSGYATSRPASRPGRCVVLQRLYFLILKRRFLGGFTFRGRKRSLAFPVKIKMLLSQHHNFGKYHANRSIFHTKHRFHYVFHCDLLWYNLPKTSS